MRASTTNREIRQHISFLLMVFALTPAVAFGLISKPAAPQIDNQFVQQQFGSTCTLLEGMPPLAGDFDGDGIEDIVIPARCTDPLLDAAEENFQVIDPLNASFGYDDVAVTSQFSTEDPKVRGWVLLVIHGNGAEAWRSDKPKAKFVVINLAFKQVRVRRVALKKKKTTVSAIFTEQSGDDRTVAALYWDPKVNNYRYQAIGSGL